MADWSYGGAYLRHDMSGEIALPNNSRLMVHDITHGLPDFMRAADTLFIDPPCSTGNLRTFHTKADRDLLYTFSDFEHALFDCVAKIAPRHMFMELFKSNFTVFHERIRGLFTHVAVYESCYYNRPGNKCWVVHASNDPLPDYPLQGLDEMKIIQWIAKHHGYRCLGDLCMGQGSVGKHAYLNGRRFVGTELNPKRLARLVEFISETEKHQFLEKP